MIRKTRTAKRNRVLFLRVELMVNAHIFAGREFEFEFKFRSRKEQTELDLHCINLYSSICGEAQNQIEKREMDWIGTHKYGKGARKSGKGECISQGKGIREWEEYGGEKPTKHGTCTLENSIRQRKMGGGDFRRK